MRSLHPWDLTAVEATAIQRRLAPMVQREGVPEDVRLVAGADISVGGASGVALAAVVVLSWPGLEPVEQAVVRAEVRFPYVPGLLSFREIPALAPAFGRLRCTPDLVVVDGQGVAHPRRFGLAAHLGVLLDVPTIGCAKSRLIGAPRDELGDERGARTPLLHRQELIGYALRTRAGAGPVYVSTGHRVSAEAAADWVLQLATHYRLPEPTRLAHLAAAGRQVAPEPPVN